MRDRMLALGIRRPSRIRNEEIVIPPLTLDDFYLGNPSEAVTKLMGESRLTMADPSARAEVATQVVELSKLCVCLGHTLHTQYSTIGNQPMTSDYLLEATVLPRHSKRQLEDLEKCDAELHEWLKNQDSRARYTPDNHFGDGDKDDIAFQTSRLHRSLLHMIYLTTVCVLHKPHVLNPESEASEGGVSKQISRKRVTEAAVAITKLAFHLQSSTQLRFLSTSSVPAFLSATLIHLLDIRSPDEQVRNISIGRFHQCVSALQDLQNMYSSADYAVHFLEMVLKKTGVTVPMMRPSGLLSDRLDDGRGQARKVYGPTPRNQTPFRIATACPSPSGFRGQQAYTNLQGRNIDESFDPSFVQPVLPFGSRDEAWSGNNVESAEHNQYNDAMSDPLLVGDWMDFESLVPGLVNFEADSNVSMLNSVSFM